MIEFEHVTFSYPAAERPALDDVTFTVPEGEWLLLVGETGSGKSTLLQAVNGLVPHFSGGRFTGSVSIDGRRTERLPPRELADLVGVVGQNPNAGFVADVVEDELAYTMENLGIPADAMRRRVEDVLDLLHLEPLRRRAISTLSSGERQRVAIGAVLTASPRVLVLDEPTSALDPGAAEEVLAALQRLVHDLGMTVMMAEHRLERVVQYADRIATIVAGKVSVGEPAAVMVDAPVAPPVVMLGRLAGWRPLPLSIRDARRLAPEMRARLAEVPRAPREDRPARGDVDGALDETTPSNGDSDDEPLASVDRVVARYGTHTALDRVCLSVHRGEIVALMGRNGAGKSTLLAQLAGLGSPHSGRVRVGDRAPHDLRPAELVRRVGLVPADPGVLLYAERIDQECAGADVDAGLEPGTTAAVLATLVEDLDPARHPRDLSEGQRLAVALAVILGPAPPLILLDEPTRGLDYAAKKRLTVQLKRLAAEGHGVLLASHDVELVARTATRVVVLAAGEVVADGPVRDVVSHSPIFAPQVAKILAPDDWLTVAEVRRALCGANEPGRSIT